MRNALPAALLLLASSAHASESALVFPSGNVSVALGLEVTIDGKRPETRWEAFLDRLFDYFDRDTSGFLTADEAGRVFALPLPGGREAKMNFARLDADKDGKGSRTEFRAFYRAEGFTPVGVVARAGPAETLQLGDALFRHLDRDGDGVLTASELRQIPALLKRFDEDEDEVLTRPELLATATPGSIPTVGLKVETLPNLKTQPAATLRVGIRSTPGLVGRKEGFRLSENGLRLAVPGGACVLAMSEGETVAGFRLAKTFYIAQFQTLVENDAAEKAAFADNPMTQALAGLFDSADRDGDGKLRRAELEMFLDLIEAGIECRVTVSVADRGRNLFDRIDGDGDGRLDLIELTRAGRELSEELASGRPLTPGRVPGSYRLTIGQGMLIDSFGPVPFGAARKPQSLVKPPAGGPRWFLAMDHNGDGYLSAAEFAGPPKLFSMFDRDKDGRISRKEADAIGH